jgi:hypothetical protein
MATKSIQRDIYQNFKCRERMVFIRNRSNPHYPHTPLHFGNYRDNQCMAYFQTYSIDRTIKLTSFHTHTHSYIRILIITRSRTLTPPLISLRSRWRRRENPPLSLLPFRIVFPHSHFTLRFIEPTLKYFFEIMFIFFISSTRVHTNLFCSIRLNFIRRG